MGGVEEQLSLPNDAWPAQDASRVRERRELAVDTDAPEIQDTREPQRIVGPDKQSKRATHCPVGSDLPSRSDVPDGPRPIHIVTRMPCGRKPCVTVGSNGKGSDPI